MRLSAALSPKLDRSRKAYREELFLVDKDEESDVEIEEVVCEEGTPEFATQGHKLPYGGHILWQDMAEIWQSLAVDMAVCYDGGHVALDGRV
ncbi:hypothetical protein EIP91_002216 [Steccherinum ochraceum]|uniref:Uncharacterized protein n=1 Tax=Steccherinum ochraceum TaxID=92696 RepID=A0A4V6N757_9APHY|nr:hypothetical protein EIP91_002216 [Steccherinum ochraceum]